MIKEVIGTAVVQADSSGHKWTAEVVWVGWSAGELCSALQKKEKGKCNIFFEIAQFFKMYFCKADSEFSKF